MLSSQMSLNMAVPHIDVQDIAVSSRTLTSLVLVRNHPNTSIGVNMAWAASRNTIRQFHMFSTSTKLAIFYSIL